MSVGVMEDYKLRDLRASHTLVAEALAFFSFFVLLPLKGGREQGMKAGAILVVVALQSVTAWAPAAG
jgi:hypothetical protein